MTPFAAPRGSAAARDPVSPRDYVSRMTLEEKAMLCSGADEWHTKAVPRLGLGAAMLTDGPHGLRKTVGASDRPGLSDNLPATCFPTASALASSWDRELLREVGAAIAEECLQEDVAVVLGPGVNIKRSPLCGRNFEYFSEDPFLAGELAAAMIAGAQGLGVGTSLKHFAVNNQEFRRMTIDAVVDERSLRELYLAAFERAVRASQPWTVMCSGRLVITRRVTGSARNWTGTVRISSATILTSI
jgi:beta-glucosidase